MSHNILAAGPLWTDVTSSTQLRNAQTLNNAQSIKERRLKLDLNQLQTLLYTAVTGVDEPLSLELPLPSGQSLAFDLTPTSVMAKALADRYPDLRTWKVTNPDNPSITGRIDLSPRGFHGLINLDNGQRIFIDPDRDSGENHYISRVNQASTINGDSSFTCQVHGNSSVVDGQFPKSFASRLFSRQADALRTYKIAIATTGEYTQLFGGSRSAALAGVVTTVNRLNQVFERDLSIRLELVANNDSLIYTSPSSDPYSNEDTAAMVEENVINVNAVIGSSNYDIGHVFGTGNTGGLAFLNSACGTYKAGGVTGSNTPSGESFNIDYVAHEIGHQLGAAHTFNGQQLNCSAGNRNASTAVEPGSGSSIMGYAGICGSDNLQQTSDAFFHSVSIDQINTYTQSSTGSSCGVLTTQTNNDPDVSAGADYTIPAQTPFKLSGTTSDSDGDPLIHSWEQIDTGAAGGLFTDLSDNPLFRTWPATSSTTRFFPQLSDQFTGTITKGETLPTTDREMNFTLLTRDNKGGVAKDDMRVNVVNTGTAFSVLSQSAPTTLSAGQAISVQWETANTNQSPIFCSAVNIHLVDNGGTSTLLLNNTANDGSQNLLVPNDIVTMQGARLQVSCVNNVFFALSQGSIDVLGGDPVISVNSPSITEEDSGIRYLTFIVSLSATASENIAISYTVTDSATSVMVNQGTVVINQGSNTTNIRVPVAGDTLDEANQILNLSLTKPLNAQFADQSNELSSQGTVIDDDVSTGGISANPDTTSSTSNSTSSASGGGSLGLLSIFGLLLLSLRQKIILRIQ